LSPFWSRYFILGVPIRGEIIKLIIVGYGVNIETVFHRMIHISLNHLWRTFTEESASSLIS